MTPPQPVGRRIAFRVSAAAERALRQGHPWLFDGAIEQQSHEGRPGDLGVVFDRQRKFLAIGLYDPTSPIRLRLLHHHRPVTIDAAWFQTQIATAVRRRDSLRDQGHTGYRLVHGENDGLPGLVVDRYAATLVVKLYSVDWVPYLKVVVDALSDLLHPQRVVIRLSRLVAVASDHLHGLRDGQVISGLPLDGPVLFLENGLTFEADPSIGQKTGFFLDQRENRARVELLAEGQEVLDLFASSGAFSVYAARGGAHTIISSDISQPALAAAARNIALNRDHPRVAAAAHELLVGDAFMTLRTLQRGRRRFGLVVIDPPAFANRQEDIDGALRAYGRLARMGAGLLRPGGALVMASCSSRVSAEEFFLTVHDAARQTGRPLIELARTGHALDHPVSFREGAYLKCLFARVP